MNPAANGLKDNLESLELALRRLGRSRLFAALQPGVPATAFGNACTAQGLRTDRGTRALYEWHDGTETAGVMDVGDIQIFPGFYFLSLRDAILDWDAFREDGRWNPEWLPIMANGGGDFYVVDLSTTSEQAPVRHFRIDESVHPIEFDGVAAMIATIVTAYERGVITVDDAGYLDMDFLVFGELAAELNPGLYVDYLHRPARRRGCRPLSRLCRGRI